MLVSAKRSLFFVSIFLTSLVGTRLVAQEPELREVCTPSYYDARIVTAEQVATAMVPSSAKGWWAIGWPCRTIYGGMESGLIAFEKGKIREKLYDWQRNYGFGFRLRNATGTQFRFSLATSSEGVTFNVALGDRPSRPLGRGPVRYPLYRP